MSWMFSCLLAYPHLSRIFSWIKYHYKKDLSIGFDLSGSNELASITSHSFSLLFFCLSRPLLIIYHLVKFASHRFSSVKLSYNPTIRKSDSFLVIFLRHLALWLLLASFNFLAYAYTMYLYNVIRPRCFNQHITWEFIASQPSLWALSSWVSVSVFILTLPSTESMGIKCYIVQQRHAICKLDVLVPTLLSVSSSTNFICGKGHTVTATALHSCLYVHPFLSLLFSVFNIIQTRLLLVRRRSWQ